MTNLRQLLDTAAGEPGSPTPDVVSSDLRRGRLALRRRRGLRTASGLVLAGAAVTVAMAVVADIGDNATTPRTVLAPAGESVNPGVDLVPWDAGATPKPISPGLVPQGWTISGNEAALVMSAPGVTTSPDDFRGKLVAMLAGDTTAADHATSLTVGSVQGTISHEGDTTILLFPLGQGRELDVQSPDSLHWDTATLVRFAQAVTVSADATAGLG